MKGFQNKQKIQKLPIMKRTKLVIHFFIVIITLLSSCSEDMKCSDCECDNEYVEYIDSRDSKTYKTIKIGKQIWMAENLAYLPSVSPSSVQSETDSIYYVYDYEGTSVSAAKVTENYKTYGVLYNWPAAINACPSGWHLPTDDEWKELEMYIGMSQSETNDSQFRGIEEGNKLKAANGWDGEEDDETNDYCFSALPGGYFTDFLSFSGIGYIGYWWSATEASSLEAWDRSLRGNNSNMGRYDDDRNDGLSVRCVKD